VLGVRVMDARGRELAFGGQVMKNVAGYDVSRVMAGSMGTLALILEASLKTVPRAPAEVTLQLEMPEGKAIESLNRWAGMGWCVSASAWSGGELRVRLSGAAAAVRAAVEAIGGERVDDEAARAYWSGIRDHRHAFFQGDTPLWRISVPQTAGPLDLAGEQLMEWGGGLRWLRSAAPAGAVRQAAAGAGGHATLFRGGERSGEVFDALSPVLFEIHRRLKAAFDPQGMFNPGRMYKDL
jgi:glycolate oxidase FAD binding subunit